MPSRRKFLRNGTVASGAVLAGMTPSVTIQMMTGGWIRCEQAMYEWRRRRIWAATQVDGKIRDTGRNRVIRLWKIWERVAKTDFVPHRQEIGDCVSQACALGLETQSAVNNLRYGGKFDWQGKISTEALYIAARGDIAQGAFGPFDGCTGSYMVRACEQLGVLPRDKYSNGDEHFDVSEYNPRLAKELASSPLYRPIEGIPKWLEPRMGKTKLLHGVLIDGGWRQACDFVANGYPIMLCSGVGYDTKPDSDGFLRKQRKGWNHSMLLWGIDSASTREGGCIANSWGDNWVEPGSTHKYGCPPGCFWADAHNIDKMLADEDSYALVEYRGPEAKDIDYIFRKAGP